MKIRNYQESDLQALHFINEEAAPDVISMSIEAFCEILGASTVLVVADEEDSPLGFMSLIEPGTEIYESPNLKWFEARQAKLGGDLVYVDRIAVTKMSRGMRLGETLYMAAFDKLAHRGAIGGEVNSIPENPGSHRFHKRLGFKDIGKQAIIPGEKEVVYYERLLSGMARA